eukprot:1938121-Prymnesium_polylepis.1
MRHSGGLLYVLEYLRTSEPRRQRVTHALHMITARVTSEPGGRTCARARKSWCAAPNFFTFTPPHTPPGPLRAMATLVGVIPAPESNGNPRGVNSGA